MLARWLPWQRRPRVGVSRTGQAVALLRAELERPHSPEGDPGAQLALCRGMRPVGSMRLRRQIAVRTRFFDEQVLDAIAAGIGQVVICGAGYDDRALRFRHQGVAFFELDHPATQADKARRLQVMEVEKVGLTLAAADFREAAVDAVLDRCGHHADQPSLFLCEGLLVYLDRRGCVRLLAGLSRSAAPGSRLAVSLATHPAGLDSKRVVSAANAGRRAGRAEPWRMILPGKAHLALVEETGWKAERTIDAAELDPRIDPERTQLVVATLQPHASVLGTPAASNDIE